MQKNSLSYYELSKHNPLQITIYGLLIVVFFWAAFRISLPIQHQFLEEFLAGIVTTDGDPIPYSFDNNILMHQPDKYFSWSIDFNVKSSMPTRYWYNPMVSVCLFIGLFAIGMGTYISALLPRQIGFIRRKIEREILNILNKLAFEKYGSNRDEDLVRMSDFILDLSERDILKFSKEMGLTVEDIKTVKNAIKWQRSPVLHKAIFFQHGIKLYMRFYFTIKYGNLMLGLVYIGASVLIITVGLRGIKFIPSTQPSYVLCSLFLEFSLLFVFAITTIYQKQDEAPDDDLETDNESRIGSGNVSGTRGGSLIPSKYNSLGNEFGNGREVEQLLKMFIKNSGTHSDEK